MRVLARPPDSTRHKGAEQWPRNLMQKLRDSSSRRLRQREDLFSRNGCAKNVTLLGCWFR
jgi:hypothetical protein